MIQIIASSIFKPLMRGVFGLKIMRQMLLPFPGLIPFQKRSSFLINLFYRVFLYVTCSTSKLSFSFPFGFHFHREHPLSNSTCIYTHHSLLSYFTCLGGFHPISNGVPKFLLSVLPSHSSSSFQLLFYDIQLSFFGLLY